MLSPLAQRPIEIIGVVIIVNVVVLVVLVNVIVIVISSDIETNARRPIYHLYLIGI